MKKQKPPLSATPPKPSGVSADDFINAANNPNYSGSFSIHKNEEKSKQVQKLPWEDERVRDDLTKVFNLRFSERYFLKLEHLSKMTKTSKHQLCMDIILNEIDKRLNIK